MRKKISFIIAAALSIPMYAQQEVKASAVDTVRVAPIESSQLRGAREATVEEKEFAKQLAKQREEQRQVDYNLPIVDKNGQAITSTDFYCPVWDYGTWRLHPGLNVNLGASAFYNTGKGYFHGDGFSQDVSMQYVTNLSPKLTLAVGGYVNHLTYKGDNYYVEGVNAMLGYRFNEHWSAYAFVQKAFSSNNTGTLFGYNNYYSPYWGGYGGMGFGAMAYGYAGMGMGYGMMNTRYMDRIGGGVTYQWGEHNQNAISINVEFDRLPSHRDNFYNVQRYDYPVRP